MNTCDKCNKEIIPQWEYRVIVVEQSKYIGEIDKTEKHCYKCLNE